MAQYVTPDYPLPDALIMSLNDDSLIISSAKAREHEITYSCTFATPPADILRLFFEAAAQPDTNDNQCRRTARNCCLVSKEVRAWVEPMLYEKVVFERSKQVNAFLDTLWLKQDEFLARAVKSIWILDKTFSDDMLYESYLILAKCQLLENFACLGSEPCIRILQNIPEPRNGPYKLRELTIMQPDSETAHHLSLRYLSIQKLQFINISGKFLDTLLQRLRIDEGLLKALRAIPRIYFDSIHIPKAPFSSFMKFELIPLLLLKAPEATNRIYIRIGRMNHRNEILDGVDDWIRGWIKSFDMLVQQSGHRLHVSKVESNQTTIDLKRAKAWISLE